MPSLPRRRFPWVMLFLACVVACVAVSRESLWIDETQTALKAVQPTLRGWGEALYAEHNSNLQLPLYMLYVWGWARVFGASELALRAANIPCFLLGFFAIAHFLRRREGLRTAALAVYCLHPFVWYYLDEARPYLMQLSGALLMTGALFAALDEPVEPLASSWWWLFGAGVVIMCGSGLLGVPWAAAVTILLLGRPGFRDSMFGAGRGALMVCGPVLIGLGGYFAWTLKLGARPGETGMSLSSIPFVFYEHLGFLGLGPGRADMRAGGARIFLHYLPALCLLGAPLAYALVRAGAARFGLAAGRLAAIVLAVAIPTLAVFALGFVKNFLVLGRHLTPLFPFVLGAMAFAIWFLWARGGVLNRGVVALIVIGLGISSLESRFAYRHQKDDNKRASAVAKAALTQGEDVWWVADGDSAHYYGLPLSLKAEPGAALFLWKPTAGEIARLRAPGLIVLSKPDLFDSYSGARDFIRQQGYREVESLPAFTFWRK